MVTKSSDVLNLIGAGYQIRMPKDGSQPEMVALKPDPAVTTELRWIEDETRPRLPVSGAVLFGMHASRMIYKLTEQRNGARSGWREMGLDGEVADWYVAMQ